MEVEAAARRRLISDPTVNGYVAGAVWKYRLEEMIEGTGGTAIVVMRDGGWAIPDSVTTQEFPLLKVRFYADPDRENGDVTVGGSAANKAFALFRVADRVLHGKRGEVWGGDNGMTVVTSQRWSEPYIVTQGDMHGQPVGGQETLGETVYVTCDYALQVIH